MNETPTVVDIVRSYLTENGYDGLAGCACGCWLDDFEPCGQMASECAPGHSDVANENDEDFEVGDRIMREGKRDAWLDDIRVRLEADKRAGFSPGSLCRVTVSEVTALFAELDRKREGLSVAESQVSLLVRALLVMAGGQL